MKLSDTGTLTADDMQARIGKLTASRMGDAMDFLRSGKESKARQDYKRDLVAERLTNIVVPHFVTNAMLHGIEQEPNAKIAYTAKTDRKIRPGFFLDHPIIDNCGATPDGFVGTDGLIECKCPTTGKYIDWITAGTVPEEHKAQMILQLAVTGKEWVDFVAYDPRMPAASQLFIRRYVPTDEEVRKVEEAAVQFLREVDELFDRISTMELV